MDFLDQITKETLIICNNSDKTNILERKKLINIKVMNIQEFISKYTFDYDENAILYIMNKHHVKYEIATMYIKNLYYIQNKIYGISKLDFLVQIKKDLDENQLLQYNKTFQTYINKIDVIVYGIRLDKFYSNMLKNINYTYIEKKHQTHEHTIYFFNTMEEEIEYVATNICKLIDNGINVNDIKLTNINSDYYTAITRIFSLFGLKVNIPYQSTLTSYKYVQDFIETYQNNNLEYAIKNLDTKNKLYDEIISVINKYLKYNNKDLILYKLKHTYIDSPKYNNGIEIINFLEYTPKDQEHIFMLSFNDGIIPNSYKDIDYITDNIKHLTETDTTKTKNLYLKEDTLKAISNIKNLVITYKLRDTKKTFYPSPLCSHFNVIKGTLDSTISYSETYNKIKLTKNIDDYIKYGYKHTNFDLLYNNFNVDYNTYNNKYNLINRVMDKLTLSYSKMQIYNKCAFRYYLTDILKIDIFEENFSTIIGNMVHYVMEKSLSNNNMDIDKYVIEFLKDRQLSNKEKFFIEKYKVCIQELINQTVLEKEYSSFNQAMYEKKINIDYGNNIKFTGIIDKILYKEEENQTYIALIDYKTGNDDISLKYLKYGLNIQLPIYLYLSNYLNLKNIVYSGFYLQKFDITNKDYRLAGYSNSDKNILSIIDSNYDNSKIIKSMKTLKSGAFSSYAKILSNDEIEQIKNITQEKIHEVIENIKNNRFDINPKVSGDKNIGCEFCKFKDICFVTKNDKVEITEQEFGGDKYGLDE